MWKKVLGKTKKSVEKQKATQEKCLLNRKPPVLECLFRTFLFVVEVGRTPMPAKCSLRGSEWKRENDSVSKFAFGPRLVCGHLCVEKSSKSSGYFRPEQSWLLKRWAFLFLVRFLDCCAISNLAFDLGLTKL